MEFGILILYIVLSFAVIFGVRLALRRYRERELKKDPTSKLTSIREEELDSRDA